VNSSGLVFGSRPLDVGLVGPTHWAPTVVRLAKACRPMRCSDGGRSSTGGVRPTHEGKMVGLGSHPENGVAWRW
jgi:hypothetical protein